MNNTVMNTFSLLQVGFGDGAAGGQLATMLVTFGLIIMIFYFLVIRPQNRRQKETRQMLSQLKKGDKVQTSGGIRGVVTAVKEDAVTIKVDDVTKVEFAKASVTSIIEQRQGESRPAPQDKEQS
jgi:preprotein translocase subunit YajC